MKARKKTLKAERKQMGSMARLIIARKSASVFLVVAMAAVAAGSLQWLLEEKNSISYTDAFKRAYNVQNIFDGTKWSHQKPEAVYPTIAMLALGLGAVWAAAHCRYLYADAHNTVRLLSGEHDVNNHTTMLYKDMFMGKLYGDAPYHHQSLPRLTYAIIKNISEKDAALLQKLVSGQTRRPTADYTRAVLDGYLKSHPNEFNNIKQNSNIQLPHKIIRKYGRGQR